MFCCRSTDTELTRRSTDTEDKFEPPKFVELKPGELDAALGGL